jgi:hypothetical protein
MYNRAFFDASPFKIVLFQVLAQLSITVMLQTRGPFTIAMYLRIARFIRNMTMVTCHLKAHVYWETAHMKITNRG